MDSKLPILVTLWRNRDTFLVEESAHLEQDGHILPYQASVFSFVLPSLWITDYSRFDRVSRLYVKGAFYLRWNNLVVLFPVLILACGICVEL